MIDRGRDKTRVDILHRCAKMYLCQMQRDFGGFPIHTKPSDSLWQSGSENVDPISHRAAMYEHLNRVQIFEVG